MDDIMTTTARVVYEISATDLQKAIETAVANAVAASEAKYRLPMYMNREKVAKILGVAPQSVSRLVKEQRLNVSFYAGSLPRFTMSDVETFIAENQKYAKD